MTPVAAVLVDAVVWAGWGTGVGFVAARLPSSRFAEDGPLTRIRDWERDGRFWEPTRVRSWKRRVPELGSLFGGVSKRRLPSPGRSGLDRLAAETRRAEVVHWAAALPVVVMPLWNPAWVTGVMALYAIAANGPFIVIQRYNRARVERILRTARSDAGRVQVAAA
jgi:glycosyl-4,4'-diaponeurosporenoate acyltransferase